MSTQISGTQVHIVDDAVSGNSGGAQLPLGSIVVEPGGTSDRTLYFIDGSGNVVGGPLFTGTGTAVIVPANTGPQEWIYVKADVALSKGEIVARKDSTIACEGVLAVAATRDAEVLGVAQHEIGAGQFGFILRKGVGEVSGAFAADVPLVSGASAAGVASVEGTRDSGIAKSLEAASGGFGTCRIDCRG